MGRRPARLSDFCAKMGSSAVVELRQQWTNFRIVARMGGFFFGCAEREPDVFRGEMGAGARLEPRFFWLFAIGGFLVK